MEFSLLGAAAIGVAGVYAALWWEAKRGNAVDCTASLWDIALTAAIAGVFAGRVAAMVSDGVNPFTNPGDVLIVRAGVATGWASVAAIGTAAWLGRRELWPVLDGLAAASLAGLAGWHAGCLARGACLGTPTDLPWAMRQAGSDIGRHPVELYAAFAFGVVAVLMARRRSLRRPPPGMAAGIALAVAGGVRLATEPWRPALGDGPIGWYLAASAVGAGVVIWSLRAGGASRSETID